MKKILILEDDLSMRGHLSELIGEVDIKTEIFSFSNVKDAYYCALERRMDLFIVDIILDTRQPGDSSGLKFVENIRNVKHYGLTPVIFVTALEDTRLYTYEKLHCYSFIEKPFDPKELKRLVRQCLCYPAGRQEGKNLYFRQDGILLVVEQDDIVYIECVKHVIHIHTKKEDFLEISYIPLKKLMIDLDNPDMIQCSRSTIINKRFVYNIDFPNRIVQFKDGFGKAEIGSSFKKQMKEHFQ